MNEATKEKIGRLIELARTIEDAEKERGNILSDIGLDEMGEIHKALGLRKRGPNKKGSTPAKKRGAKKVEGGDVQV
jgi:hypothetical protein